MKSLGPRIIRGVLDDNEGLRILSNEATGRGWLIRDFRIMPNRPSAFEQTPPGYYSARLSTAGGLGTSDFAFDDNQVLAIASFVNGNLTAIFDSHQLITTDLLITAMSSNPTAADEPLAFQIELEAYSITEFEEVVATIKETAQSGAND